MGGATKRKGDAIGPKRASLKWITYCDMYIFHIRQPAEFLNSRTNFGF